MATKRGPNEERDPARDDGEPKRAREDPCQSAEGLRKTAEGLYEVNQEDVTAGSTWVVQDLEGHLVTATVKFKAEERSEGERNAHGETLPCERRDPHTCSQHLWHCEDDEGNDIVATLIVPYREEILEDGSARTRSVGSEKSAAGTGGEPSKNGQNHGTTVTVKTEEPEQHEDFTRNQAGAPNGNVENRALLDVKMSANERRELCGYEAWRKQVEPELRRIMPTATAVELQDELRASWLAESEAIKNQAAEMAAGTRRRKAIAMTRAVLETTGYQEWRAANRENILLKKPYAAQHANANLFRYWTNEDPRVKAAYKYAEQKLERERLEWAARLAEAEGAAKADGGEHIGSAGSMTGGSTSGGVGGSRVGATHAKGDLDALSDGLKKLGLAAARAGAHGRRATEAEIAAQAATVQTRSELARVEEVANELKTVLSWAKVKRAAEREEATAPSVRTAEFESIRQSLMRTENKASANHTAMEYWKSKYAATGADIEAANQELVNILGQTVQNAVNPGSSPTNEKVQIE